MRWGEPTIYIMWWSREPMNYDLITRVPPWYSEKDAYGRVGSWFVGSIAAVWVFGQAGRLARSGNSVGSVRAGHDSGPRLGATRQWYAGRFVSCKCFFRGQFLQYPFPSASCRSPSWSLEPFTHGDDRRRRRRQHRSLPSLPPVGPTAARRGGTRGGWRSRLRGGAVGGQPGQDVEGRLLKSRR